MYSVLPFTSKNGANLIKVKSRQLPLEGAFRTFSTDTAVKERFQLHPI